MKYLLLSLLIILFSCKSERRNYSLLKYLAKDYEIDSVQVSGNKVTQIFWNHGRSRRIIHDTIYTGDTAYRRINLQIPISNTTILGAVNSSRIEIDGGVFDSLGMKYIKLNGDSIVVFRGPKHEKLDSTWGMINSGDLPVKHTIRPAVPDHTTLYQREKSSTWSPFYTIINLDLHGFKPKEVSMLTQIKRKHQGIRETISNGYDPRNRTDEESWDENTIINPLSAPLESTQPIPQYDSAKKYENGDLYERNKRVISIINGREYTIWPLDEIDTPVFEINDVRKLVKLPDSIFQVFSPVEGWEDHYTDRNDKDSVVFRPHNTFDLWMKRVDMPDKIKIR